MIRYAERSHQAHKGGGGARAVVIVAIGWLGGVSKVCCYSWVGISLSNSAVRAMLRAINEDAAFIHCGH